MALDMISAELSKEPRFPPPFFSRVCVGLGRMVRETMAFIECNLGLRNDQCYWVDLLRREEICKSLYISYAYSPTFRDIGSLLVKLMIPLTQKILAVCDINMLILIHNKLNAISE